MNLYFRLVHLLLFARFRPRRSPVDEVVTPFRVWPTDLDANLHMNNGRFLQVMDLARVDLMLRSNLASRIRRARLFPVVASQTIRYRRSLSLFQRFEISTQLIGWDEDFVFLRQRFVAGGETVALATIKAAFLERGAGRVKSDAMLRLVDVGDFDPSLPEWAEQWSASEETAWSAEA